jgi:hypothetical protein
MAFKTDLPHLSLASFLSFHRGGGFCKAKDLNIFTLKQASKRIFLIGYTGRVDQGNIK